MACSEALAVGVKAGVDLKTLIDVINASSARNIFTEVMGPLKAFKVDYDPLFTAEMMTKDLGLAMNLGKEQGIPLFMGTLSHQMYLYINSLGLGGKDFSVIVKVFEDLLNVKLKY